MIRKTKRGHARRRKESRRRGLNHGLRAAIADGYRAGQSTRFTVKRDPIVDL
jgi:hypothetical protein